MPRFAALAVCLLLAGSLYAQDQTPPRTFLAQYTLTIGLADAQEPYSNPSILQLADQPALTSLEVTQSETAMRDDARVRQGNLTAHLRFASMEAFRAWYEAAATQQLLSELRTLSRGTIQTQLALNRFPGN